MEWTNITLTQWIVMWVSCMGIALIGATIKGGGKMAVTYLPTSLLLGPVALVLLMLDRRKTCPFCHHIIKPSHKVCPHCEHRLVYTEQ